MKRKNTRLGSKLKIAGATATAIFSLASVFSATYAWFASQNSVEATGMAVSVKAEDGIQFNLYYLDYFAVNQSVDKEKDGNYDSVINAYAGYERATANPVFKLVNYDANGNVINDDVHGLNPMNITNLWPAHRLTYAIVIDSDNLSSFYLDSWSEVRDPNVLTQVENQDIQVSLSWAINIFGGAYYVSNTGNVLNDIKTGFASYTSDNNVVDKFTYSQTLRAPEGTKPSLNIVDTVSGTSGNNDQIILFFTIEFSDDNSTFYSYNNPYYVKDTLGNSNCYENLSLTNLSFRLL